MDYEYVDTDESGDPDAVAPNKRPAWMKPKDALDRDLLKATGCKWFKNRELRKTWNQFREQCRGATDDDILILAWGKHNIELAQKKNASGVIVRTTQWVINRCLDETTEGANRRDWMAANRERILKEKSKEIRKNFFGE